jgi:hypothetical protein
MAPRTKPQSQMRFVSLTSCTLDHTQSKADSVKGKVITKAQAKLQRDVNKLVVDKKATLKDFTVEISHTLQGHPFVSALKSKLVPHNGGISFFKPPPEVEHLIQFRRRHMARYDGMLKEWVAVEPHTSLEDLYVIFISADFLALAISEESLVGLLAALRSSHSLSSRSQIFLMVDGINAYYNRKDSHKVKRNFIESTMASLQATERCFIVYVDGPEDTSQWLFNITGDLGMSGTHMAKTLRV